MLLCPTPRGLKAGCSAQAASECEYEALRAAALRTAARCLPNVVVAPTFGELLASQPALAVGFLREAALAAKCPCEPDELLLPDSVLAAAGADSKAAAEDPDNRFAKLWGDAAPAYYLAACERNARKRRSGPYARYRTQAPEDNAEVGGGVRGPGWARGGAPALRCPEPGLGVRAGGGPADALRPLRPVPPADRALALRLDTPGDSPAAPLSVAEAAVQLGAWQELQALNRRPTDDGAASGAGSDEDEEGEEEDEEDEDEEAEGEEGDGDEDEEGTHDIVDDEVGGVHDQGDNEGEVQV